MVNRFTLCTLLFALLISTATFAQLTLSTAPPSNGSGGVFLTLTTNATPVTISKFNTYFAGTVGLTRTVEIYTRPGAYSGFTASSSGWTLLGTATAIGAGTAVLALMDVSALNIQIPANTVQSFYLHSITSGGGIRYTGTASNPPVTTFSDANLSLFSDVARTGTVAFAGSQNVNRTFAGEVEYSISPLSVTWIKVSGKSKHQGAVISWEVEEKEVYDFRIEKETPNGYLTLATIPSKGDGHNWYEATVSDVFDEQLSVATFRVKQTNRQGKVSYSPMVAVKKSLSRDEITMYPNPFADILYATVSSAQTISITDLTGRSVARLVLPAGTHPIYSGSWAPGVYTLTTSEGEHVRLIKK